MSYKKHIENLLSPQGKTGPADINSVRFHNLGWKLIHQAPDEIAWECPNYPAILSTHFLAPSKDHPSLSDLSAIRNTYRKTIQQMGGVLMQCDLIKMGDFDAIMNVSKMPLYATLSEPNPALNEGQPVSVVVGTVYVGAFNLLFGNCSYVIRIRSHEFFPQGLPFSEREKIVFEELIQAGILKADESGNIPGWAFDPYDLAVNEGYLMNMSDGSQYNERFPNHALSVLHQSMSVLAGTFQFEKSLYALPPYVK